MCRSDPQTALSATRTRASPGSARRGIATSPTSTCPTPPKVTAFTTRIVDATRQTPYLPLAGRGADPPRGGGAGERGPSGNPYAYLGMARIRGAAVVITGASSGIGAATAVAFARRRARLALCARRFDRLQGVADQCRQAGATEVFIRKADIGRPGEARGFISFALHHLDRIDILVNNAGRGWRGRLQDMTEEEVLSVFDTNLLGSVWTVQATLPVMLTQGSGVIINVGSV